MSKDFEEQQGEEILGEEHELMDRRGFLVGLKKWSKIVIGGVLFGSALLNPAMEKEAEGAAWANRAGGGGAWANRAGGGGAWANRVGGGGVWANRGVAWANGGGSWANGGVWANRGAVWANGGGAWINRF